MTLFDVANTIQAPEDEASQTQPPPNQAGSALSQRWYGRPSVLAIALLLLGGVALYALKPWTTWMTPDTPTVVTSSEPTTVSALGTIEPEGEAIAVSATAAAQNSRVDQLLVSRGEQVKSGEIIAIMDQHESAQAAVARAEEEVRVAEAQLAQVQAGAKQGDIAAQAAEIARIEADRQARINGQQATVTRLEAELSNAESDYQRYESLHQDGAISASERDSRGLTLETAQRNLQNARAELDRLQTTRSPELNAARAALDSISEVREVDVHLAQTEVNRAIAVLQQAKADLEQTYVRSPQDGVVLEVYTRPGERPDTSGIVEIGQIEQMVVVAEVYESDIQRVELGQPAVITSHALSQPLTGVVAAISSKVQEQDIIAVDPSATIDNRVVEVDIHLDEASTAIAQSFTNLQVAVEIAQ